MRKQLVGIATLGTLAIALTAGPSVASPPTGLSSYAAGADTLALGLDAPLLGDVSLTAAETSAGVNSTPAAAADGRALTSPLFSTDAAPSAQPGGASSNSTCAQIIDLPAPLDLLTVPLACVDTTAATTPTATSASDEVTISAGGAGLTEQVLTPLLTPVITPIVDGIAAIPDELVNAAVAQVIGLIVDSLVDPDDTTVEVTVAPNSSDTSASAEQGVLAHALSQGATIKLLPTLAGGPLLTITVGQAEAQVVRNATTGEATPTVTPATVLIDWNTITVPPITLLGAIDITDISDQLEAAINGLITQLATNNPFACNPAPPAVRSPLADVLCLDAASGQILDAAQSAAEGFDFGAGTVGARANALHVEVLGAAVPGGAVILDLAKAVAAANATPVAPATTAPSSTAPLARTGGPTPGGSWLIVVFAVGMGALVLTRRAAVVRS